MPVMRNQGKPLVKATNIGSQDGLWMYLVSECQMIHQERIAGH